MATCWGEVMETIRIEAVTGASGAWYDDYRRLRYRVFVMEQEWVALADADEPGLTSWDPVDAHAWFWLAWSDGGTLVGAVRVRAVSDVFPHEELFRHHLRRPEVASVRPWMGTLNSLVVAADWRRRPCLTRGGELGTVAGHLLSAAVAGSRTAGLRAIVATAQTHISARALMRAGFRVIDAPAHTSLHPVFPMCNVGLSLSDDGHGRALRNYFDQCERHALAGHSIAALFSRAPLAATG
jgi:N-acyl-L-homoserine lactone synthetase